MCAHVCGCVAWHIAAVYFKMSSIDTVAITKVVTISWDCHNTSQSVKTQRWIVTTKEIDGDDYFELDKCDSGLARFVSCDSTTTNGKRLIQRSSWLTSLKLLTNQASNSHDGSEELFGIAPQRSRWFKAKIANSEAVEPENQSQVVELQLPSFKVDDETIPGTTMKVKRETDGRAKVYAQLTLPNLMYIRNAIIASANDDNNKREKCPISLPKMCTWVKRKYKKKGTVRGILAKKQSRTIIKQKKAKRFAYKFFPVTDNDYHHAKELAETWMQCEDDSGSDEAEDDAGSINDDTE